MKHLCSALGTYLRNNALFLWKNDSRKVYPRKSVLFGQMINDVIIGLLLPREKVIL